MSFIRDRWWLLSMIAIAASTARCACGPQPPGAECDPAADAPCEEGLVCAERDDGTSYCLIQAGGECDPDAEDAYCEPRAECYSDDDTGICLMTAGGSCGDDDALCGPDLVCEPRAGEEDAYVCGAATVIQGRVLDAADDQGIGGARVIALDGQQTPVTDVAISDPDGSYALRVPVPRDADGKPAGAAYTLRASAADYQTFPGGLRSAIPIDVATAEAQGGGYVISGTLTDILLVPMQAGEIGRPHIAGHVEAGEDSGGVLVVVEGGARGYSALSDQSGGYVVFNVPAGSYTVRGYRAGLQLEPVSITVQTDDLEDVDLSPSSRALSTVSGNLQIVNAFGGAATSVVLVVESTFSPIFVRGEVPPGLRTPRVGEPDVTGGWSIEEVPDGRYVVLAAFENDDLVRDPDTNIAGTDIITITVPDPSDGTDVTVGESFKITEALKILGPGADQPEAVGQAPTLSWEDDSSEAYYQVVVYNAYGDLVWEEPRLDSVSGGDVAIGFGGPALERGMYYQFRATSWREPGGNPAPISTTEDLRGVFFLAD